MTDPTSTRPTGPERTSPLSYCRELPPDVPPGMTLDEWRRARHPRRRRRRLRPWRR